MLYEIVKYNLYYSLIYFYLKTNHGLNLTHLKLKPLLTQREHKILLCSSTAGTILALFVLFPCNLQVNSNFTIWCSAAFFLKLDERGDYTSVATIRGKNKRKKRKERKLLKAKKKKQLLSLSWESFSTNWCFAFLGAGCIWYEFYKLIQVIVFFFFEIFGSKKNHKYVFTLRIHFY
jgi:hypothetical protein